MAVKTERGKEIALCDDANPQLHTSLSAWMTIGNGKGCSSWVCRQSLLKPKSVFDIGLRGCKNGPAPIPGRMSYKATKPGLFSVLYLSMFFIVLMFIRAPFYTLLVFIVCVVCPLVVLVKLSLLAKLLARMTPLSSESSPLQFLALA